jgi:hypothetical protein
VPQCPQGQYWNGKRCVSKWEQVPQPKFKLPRWEQVPQPKSKSTPPQTEPQHIPRSFHITCPAGTVWNGKQCTKPEQ